MKNRRFIRLNLFLLKFWSVYDSLFYSTKSLVKIKSWHDSGKYEIKKLIAKLGIPLDESKQKYESLSGVFKETLKEKMLELEDGQYFIDLLRTSFIYVLDSRHSYNSLDHYNIILGVLNTKKDFNKFVLNLESNNSLAIHQTVESENFWTIYNKLLELYFY